MKKPQDPNAPRMKRIRIDEIGSYYLDGPIEEAIASLQALRDQNPGGVFLSSERDWEDSPVVGVYVERLETDDERDRRVAEEADQQRRQAEIELRQLAALKAKYGEA